MLIALALALLLPASGFSAGTDAKDKVFLDTLTPVEQFIAYDTLRLNRTLVKDEQVDLGARRPSHYLFTHANARIVYELPPGATRFQAIGAATTVSRDNSTWFYEVWADGALLFRSLRLSEYKPREVAMDVAIPIGSKRLMLLVDNDGGAFKDHAIWAEACVVLGAASPAAAPATPRNLISKLPAAQLDGIMLVEGDRSVGTGFVALIRDQPYVVTNQHVLAGNKRVSVSNRTGLRPAITGYIFARDRDLALLRIDADPATLPLLRIADSASAAAVGADLLIAGNSEGGGTILQSEGRIVGFGPERIEHDVATVSGNSGSPIFGQSNWEVLAVDTYARIRSASRTSDPASRSSAGSSLADFRHFGVRIDTAKDWSAINWESWQKECALMNALENRLAGLEKLLTEDRADWITYPDIASRVQYFEDRTRGMKAGTEAFKREATFLFQNLVNYAQAQQRSANELKERNIGHLRQVAENLANDAIQFETTLRAWDVTVADRLKSAAR